MELHVKLCNGLPVGVGHLLRHFTHNFLQHFAGVFDLPGAASSILLAAADSTDSRTSFISLRSCVSTSTTNTP